MSTGKAHENKKNFQLAIFPDAKRIFGRYPAASGLCFQRMGKGVSTDVRTRKRPKAHPRRLPGMRFGKEGYFR